MLEGFSFDLCEVDTVNYFALAKINGSEPLTPSPAIIPSFFNQDEVTITNQQTDILYVQRVQLKEKGEFPNTVQIICNSDHLTVFEFPYQEGMTLNSILEPVKARFPGEYRIELRMVHQEKEQNSQAETYYQANAIVIDESRKTKEVEYYYVATEPRKIEELTTYLYDLSTSYRQPTSCLELGKEVPWGNFQSVEVINQTELTTSMIDPVQKRK